MNYLIFRNDGIGDLIVSSCGINQLRKIDNKANITLICSNHMGYPSIFLDFQEFMVLIDQFLIRLKMVN